MKTVRGEEMKEVARLYGARLQHEYYYNAPLPVESFPPRHEIAQKWQEERQAGQAYRVMRIGRARVQ